MKPYVQDYRINLFEIAYMTQEQVKSFKSDFRFVADYFVQMRETGTYKGSTEEVKHIREVLQLLAVLAREDRFQEAADVIGKGDNMKVKYGNMCKALDVIEERGFNNGFSNGFHDGCAEGEEKLARLINILVANNRNEDVIKAVTDSEKRQKLYAEFSITIKKKGEV